MNKLQGTAAALLATIVLACAAPAAPGDDLASGRAVDADTLRHAIDESMHGDAALADVCFVDPMMGWAVGDRGAVWHTSDGGCTWQPQASHTSSRLTCVYFLDARLGWAVGGTTQSTMPKSRGIVLRTRDGGGTWSEVPHLMLPMLTRVQFFDARRGVAIGAASSTAPGGVFYTIDGGQSWQPVPAEGRGDWLAGDFVGPAAGAVAGTVGRAATVVNGRVALSPLASATSRAARALRLTAPTSGWLVGDGGLVMATHDLGRSWQSPPTELPESISDNFDFRAVAVQGKHVWIAGAPGTRVIHSADGGRTWQSFSTGQTVPLRALSFIDERTGWAVGDLGTILATEDGGRSWQVQRAGGRRAALVALFGRATDVPLEMLAQYGAAEGYLTSVDLLHPRAAGDGAEFSSEECSRDALLAAGAASAETAWRFPLPPDDLALAPDELLAALNREQDGRAIERLTAHIVREIRTWRPDVVATYHPDYAETNPVAALSQELIYQAIEAAADPTQYVELTTEAGLEPWRVKRVFGLMPAGSRGEQLIVTNEFSPRLGRTLADWTAPSRHSLHATHATPPDAYTFQPVTEDDIASTGRRDFFTGIVLSPGGEARRPWIMLPEGDVDALRRMAQKRRNMQELLERTEGNAAWAGQVGHLVDGLDATSGGELLFQLAEGYEAAGRLDLAADTYYLLTRRWPDHPLADRALVWLVQFYASSEAAQGCRLSTVGRQPDEDEISPVENSVRQASTVMPLAPAASPAVGLSRDDRLRRAVQLGDYLEKVRPALFAEPAVQFPLVAAQRQLGFANPAQRYYLTLRGLPDDDPWRRCAETELWFAQPGDQPPPKALGICRRASQRPHLDGKLDEPFWESADALRLTSEKIPAVRLAYDDKFLYVAVHCPKAAGVDYKADDLPRERDTDLSQHDRVAILLDVDRDFATSFELVVDDRGWPRDACAGDIHWNPQWFIARASDDDSWTIEAAVPLVELVAEPPAARQVWAVAVRRTIPKTGHQSWAGEGDSPDDSQGYTPEQFGLVLFD